MRSAVVLLFACLASTGLSAPLRISLSKAGLTKLSLTQKSSRPYLNALNEDVPLNNFLDAQARHNLEKEFSRFFFRNCPICAVITVGPPAAQYYGEIALGTPMQKFQVGDCKCVSLSRWSLGSRHDLSRPDFLCVLSAWQVIFDTGEWKGCHSTAASV